jgi:hypothetical protein
VGRSRSPTRAAAAAKTEFSPLTQADGGLDVPTSEVPPHDA